MSEVMGEDQLDYSDHPEIGRKIRTDKPKKVKVTMLVLDAKGEALSDITTVAENARDSWLTLLTKLGVEFDGFG